MFLQKRRSVLVSHLQNTIDSFFLSALGPRKWILDFFLSRSIATTTSSNSVQETADVIVSLSMDFGFCFFRTAVQFIFRATFEPDSWSFTTHSELFIFFSYVVFESTWLIATLFGPFAFMWVTFSVLIDFFGCIMRSSFFDEVFIGTTLWFCLLLIVTHDTFFLFFCRGAFEFESLTWSMEPFRRNLSIVYCIHCFLTNSLNWVWLGLPRTTIIFWLWGSFDGHSVWIIFRNVRGFLWTSRFFNCTPAPSFFDELPMETTHRSRLSLSLVKCFRFWA